MGRVIAKQHRMDRSCYVGRIVVSITCCIYQKRDFFTTQNRFNQVKDKLLHTMELNQCDLLVYVFMPNHCHLLIQGKTDISDVWKAVVDFKQHSGYWFKCNEPEYMWQEGFYDHILRKEDDVRKQISYILANPMRRSIVEDWKSYPYKGSTVFELSEWEQGI